jgi:hypothetical protein
VTPPLLSYLDYEPSTNTYPFLFPVVPLFFLVSGFISTRVQIWNLRRSGAIPPHMLASALGVAGGKDGTEMTRPEMFEVRIQAPESPDSVGGGRLAIIGGEEGIERASSSSSSSIKKVKDGLSVEVEETVWDSLLVRFILRSSSLESRI